MPHRAYQHRRRVVRLGHARGKFSRRRLINFRRRAHLERFVGTHLIVFLPKAIQRLLLLAAIARRRLRGLGFQRAMHTLVPAVLLRMPGLDALGHDAQLDPPHRQTRQPGQRPRSKRRAVVGADGLRQAVLAESRFKNGLHAPGVGLLHRLTAQQLPAVRIGDRQRINALSIRGVEPAFEISAPHTVGFLRLRQGFAVRRGAQALLARHDQTFALQQCADGAGGRPVAPRLVALQDALQLSWPPAHVRLPEFQNHLLDLLGGLVVVTVGGAAVLPQSDQAVGPVAPQPHVPGLACDPVLLTEFLHGLFAQIVLTNKSKLFFHYTARFPWHARSLLAAPAISSQCQESSRSVLSAMRPVRTQVTYPPTESVWQLKPWRREQGNFMVHLLTFRVVGLWSLALLRAERSQRGVSCHIRIRLKAMVARANSAATFPSPRIRNRRIPRCSFKMPKTGSTTAFRRRYNARPAAESSFFRSRRCAG